MIYLTTREGLIEEHLRKYEGRKDLTNEEMVLFLGMRAQISLINEIKNDLNEEKKLLKERGVAVE